MIERIVDLYNGLYYLQADNIILLVWKNNDVNYNMDI